MAEDADNDQQMNAPGDELAGIVPVASQPAANQSSMPESADDEIALPQEPKVEISAQPIVDTTKKVPPISVASALPPDSINGQPLPPTAQQLDEEHLKFANDLATKAIVPKTYNDLFNDKSTVGKASTLFGLILGGAGSGLTGQPNAVLQMMNKLIDNDLEAQKASKANANTWLSTAYAHEVQQSQAALERARLTQIPLSTKQLELQNKGLEQDNFLKAQNAAKNGMMISMLQNYQDQADNAAPSIKPIALDKINNVIKPAVIQQVGQNNAQTAAQLDSRFKIRQDQLRLLGEGDLAQSNEARYVPGVGQGAVPVNSEDRNQILAAQNFNNKINKYEDFVKKTTALGKLDPSQINQGKVLAAELQTAFRQATNGGVYKEGEKNYIDSIIPSDPTKFFSDIRVMPQIQAIRDDANDRYSNLLKSKGLPPPQNQTQNQSVLQLSGADIAAKAWADSHPNDARAAAILKKLQNRGQ